MIARFSRAAHAAAPSPSLTALLLALVLLAACAPEPPPQERPPRPVRVAEAIRLSTDAERTFSGEVEAPARSRLSFRVPGRLVHRPVEIGTRLKAGQTVAELEATDYRLRTEQASAALERNRAEAREAENNYARIRALYADDNATRSELDRALATLERTRGAAVEAERGLAIARRELGYTRLEASESGVVTDLFAERGENVAAGQAVAELTQEDAPLEVAWPVPEGLIGRFRPGLRVEVAFPALDGVRRQATVEEVGAAPREGRTTFPVVARFAERDPRLRPGMAAEVRVALPSGLASGGAPVASAASGTDVDRTASPATEIVVLPPHAVAGDPRGRYVFVLDAITTDAGGDPEVGERRIVRRRGVEVGRLLPEGLEILRGLDGGETVVAAGVTFLADGQTVRLLRGDPLAELPSTSSALGESR